MRILGEFLLLQNYPQAVWNCSIINIPTGLQENIFHGQTPGLWPLKIDKPEQIHCTKSPDIKVLLINKL